VITLLLTVALAGANCNANSNAMAYGDTIISPHHADHRPHK
jgi:hypothetical protein